MTNDPDWDSYFYPGTTVLRNKITNPSFPDGITNPVILDHVESGASVIRMAEILSAPVSPEARFDLDYARAIHRHLFQDVYEFAGDLRTGPREGLTMTKRGPDVVAYAPGDPAAPKIPYFYAPIADVRNGGAEKVYATIDTWNSFQGLDHQRYVRALAAVWGAVNYQHVFREGNTRTQAVFFAQLAERGGYDLDLTRFGVRGDLREEFVNARHHHLATQRTDRLEAAIDKALAPIPDTGLDRTPTIGALLAATRGAATTSSIRPVSLHTRPPAAPEVDRGRDTGHGVGD